MGPLAVGRLAGRARPLVRTGLAHALYWTRGDALLGQLAGPRPWPLVVGYHRVVEDFAAEAADTIPALLISRATLEAQLDWIGERFRFVTLDELGRRLESGEPVRDLAAVTFDDGYRDLYEVAFPVLRRKGIPAAAFVVTDAVTTGAPLIHDLLHGALARAFDRWADAPAALTRALDTLGVPAAERPAERPADPRAACAALLRALSRADVHRLLDALGDGAAASGPAPAPPLTWAMLREMQRAGITIGSHTRGHAWLTRETPDRVREELVGSRVLLEQQLGRAVHHLAYPDGRFDAATLDAVAAAGYRFAYTTCRHRDPARPLLTIPRRLLWERSSRGALRGFAPAVLSCQVRGVFDRLDPCEQGHGA